jgi:hypothetical protein
MFAGIVTLEARMVGLQFDRLEVDPAAPGVIKIVLSAGGTKLQLDVEVYGVATEEDGERLAFQIAEQICNRLAYAGSWGISPALIKSSSFRSLKPPTPGVHEIMVRDYMRVTDNGSAVVTPGPDRLATLKADLELPTPPGEQHFSMFRAALASGDPVVQFMVLYQLLLTLFNDDQRQVDAFIRNEEPGVPQTQHPGKKPDIMETVYSRLRNEFAHKRAGVDMNATKLLMANYAPAMAHLTKRAIQAHP